MREIITFDQGGVSLHPNHIATFRGAQRVLAKWPTTCSRPPPQLLVLHTLSWRTKFTGVIAAAIQIIIHPFVRSKDVLIIGTPGGYIASLLAMRSHDRQLVWFRYLYLITSVYLHANWLRAADAQE